MKYRTFIAPHSDCRCFAEVEQMTRECLRERGLECEPTAGLYSGFANIVFGANLLPPIRDCIIFQLEQLHEGSPWWREEYEMTLRNAAEVWDYSLDNIAFLKRKGIYAAHVPIGAHPSLRRIPLAADPEKSILFYGSLNRRRKDVIDGCRKFAPVETLFGVFGEERDRRIGESLINLNVHYYDAMIFEAVRVSYLLNNGCLVVSEASPSYPYAGVDLPMADAKSVPDLCARFIEDRSDAYRTRRLNAEQFRDLYPMSKFIGAVLDGSPVTSSHAA